MEIFENSKQKEHLKILNAHPYLVVEKKLTRDSGYMIEGIYVAVESVVNRAILQDDFNKIEKVLEELVKIEPNSYKPNVWLAFVAMALQWVVQFKCKSIWTPKSFSY